MPFNIIRVAFFKHIKSTSSELFSFSPSFQRVTGTSSPIDNNEVIEIFRPVAIMSALIINQVLTISNGHIGISFPALIGCLVTAIAIKIIKMFLPSVGIGIVAGLLARYFL